MSSRILACDGCKAVCDDLIYYTFWRENLRVYLQFCERCHDRILGVMNNLAQ